MFENLNWWEIGALLLLALLIFGDRLPNVIADGLRMLRNLRKMAHNATTDLSRELGTDIQLEDLHPKAFIRKHLLSEEEEEALKKPLRGLYDDVKSDLDGVHTELKDVAAAADLRSTHRPAGRAARSGGTSGEPATGSGTDGSTANGSTANGSLVADGADASAGATPAGAAPATANGSSRLYDADAT